MKMNDGSEADRVIHVDGTGQKGTPDMGTAYADGFSWAAKGQKVLILVHPGTYSVSHTLQHHPNMHTRGVGPDGTFDTQND